MKFKIPGKSTPLLTSTIELFNRLGKLERLSLQQGQSLEEYEKLRQEHTDIAIEMPAGHGKTLVGGLIGEYNRQAKGWRVVYCCATRQLASQTHSLLESYGIKSVLLVGKVADFSQLDSRAYSRSSAVAVTTYSHIFNINPKFNDANLIIFDDAHATEYSINDFWSLEVKRHKEEHKDIFNTLYSIIKGVLPLHIQDKIEHGTYDPLIDGVDIIPQPLWLDKQDEIRSFLDQVTKGKDLYFPWTKLRNNLHGCQFYISHNKLVIKPVVAPNKQHLPFYNANERIYMSATLGSVGELERVFGIPEIQRISKFSKGSNKVSGRRLILFPEDHFEKSEIANVLIETIRMQPRAFVLFPSQDLLDGFKGFVEKNIPEYKIFLDHDIEDSLDGFKTCSKGILLLSGRYEGIDLKDSECRLQIFFDLPVAVGISEQFLQTRLRASEILKSRLSTRLIQGLGRCTRGTNDYATILFLGRRVGEYLYKNDFRNMLPAEINAELNFGFEQIEYIRDLDSWKELLELFFTQDEEWSEADEYIKTTTSTMQIETESSEVLDTVEKAAIHEVNFQYYLLEKNFEKSHEEIDQILRKLSRDSSLKGYRAWWNYQIACIANQQNDKVKTKKYLQNALGASSNKLWIDKELLELTLPEEVKVYAKDVEIQLENIITKLLSFGDRNKRFEKDWGKIISGLKQKKAELYEPALRDFGEFLGVSSYRPEGKGTPDGIWNLQGYWIAFEAKTNIENPDTEIALDDIRQSGFHKKWVIKKYGLAESSDVTVCILCAKKYIEKYAEHAADELYLLDPQTFMDKANQFGDILREVLHKIKFSTIEEAKEYLAEEIIKQKFTISDIVEWLKSTKLINVVKS
ncbi:helicase C-terminal domain-containing protein [Bacillus toyonensis]|uniref:helicase C-terminal domain-containing protein n=1 Tax=Bacillus toyonensis TaxID=155322 RepID=UPI0021CE0456|nr:helicase C-terminal domain-containing protein [Bacillus toyonensis]MCU4768281.1 DEAD/DEAH box helicase family protein [Bacillus toyonensis]